MVFRQLKDDESSTYTYLVADPGTREAVLIDTVREHVDWYLEILGQYHLNLVYSLDTHVHADHITGSGMLRQKTGCRSVMGDLSRAECVDLRLKDDEKVKFGSFTIRVIHTPGHTPCHVAYALNDRVFTGDSLFIGGCGRTDFQNGNSDDLWNSVTRKLFSLPPDTLVYPGHDYNGRRVSCIQQEMDTNPRFKGQTQQGFRDIMSNLSLSDPKKMMEAVPANEQCGMKK